MSRFLDVVLARRTLIGLAVVAAGLFVLAGLVAAIFGNPADNAAIDAVGAIAWFGWMLAALVLLVLSLGAIIRRATATRGPAST